MKIFEFRAGSLIDKISKTVMTATDVVFKRTEKGHAGLFDGTTSKIDTGTDMIGTKAVTICAWIKPYSSGESNNGRIMDNGKLYFFQNSGTYRFSSDGINTAIGTQYSLYKYQFVVVTRTTNGTVNFYIGDHNTYPALSGSAEQDSGTPVAGTTNIIIGNNDIQTRTFDGYISKIEVYDHILTTQEIDIHYQEFLRATPIEKQNRNFAYPKSTDLSHERNTQFTGDEYIQVMEFTDNSGTTSNLRLNSGGDFAVIDWTGDSDFQEISTSTETNSNVIPSTVKIFAKNGELTYFRSNNNKYNFDIANLPSGLTYYNNAGSNTTTGDIGNLPSGLTYYYNYGSNTTTGDIANLPSGVTRYINAGNNQVDTYTAGRTWDSGVNYIEHKPAAGYGLFSTEVDNLLIDLDNSGMSSGTIDISGNNAARTSASDSAVTSLKGKGVSVTTN